MKERLRIVNAIALAITIFCNYLASSGVVNGQTVGDISDKYHTLFTPAGYAFSIWGLIYLLLIGFVISRFTSLFHRDNETFILQVGWWFVVSCIANCLWIFAWIYEWTGFSLLMITLLLISLLKIVVNTNMERWDAPLKNIFFEWWPFCVYAGWVAVATIANVAAYLTKIGWDGFGLNPAVWAIIMIGVAGLLNLYMIASRNMREFAAVGIWALIAIAVANGSLHPSITRMAVMVSVILFIAISYQAYINWETSPIKRLMG